MNVVFEKEKIVSGLTGIILLSHGPLATALIGSAEMIIGEQQNLAAFGLEPCDTLEEYAAAVVEAYNAFDKNALVLLDLFGGTPCNQFTLAMLRMEECAAALAGMNLPMLMEACTLRSELSGGELVSTVAELSSAGIVNITEKLNVKNH